MKFINPILISNKRRIGLALALLFSCAASIIAAPFIVTTTVDNGNNATPTPGSFRAGINSVNAAVSTAIHFNIPTSDPGYNATNNTWTIQPPVDLPNIVNTVTIDGYTQAGSSVNTLAQGDNAVLTIILNGSNYTVGDGLVTGNGLHFAPLVSTSVNGSVVRGLVINQWLDNGILLDTTNANITGVQIIGNFIGTNASGTQQMANRCGIGLSGAVNQCINTVIGTAAFADRNIIAGSFASEGLDSYSIYGASISSYANTGTTINNNYLGTDTTGTIALENSQVGIILNTESSSTIGGSNPLGKNLISGNSVYGVRLRASSSCVIQGNYIGTDITGTLPLGNKNAGIESDHSDGGVGCSIIGNVISGNGAGIHIGQTFTPGSTNNIIQANLIGTDFSGKIALQNNRYGIEVNDNLNTIGGSITADSNIISGNASGGIVLFTCTGNSIQGNLIGVDKSGIKPLANQGPGVQIGLIGGMGGASNNTLGA